MSILLIPPYAMLVGAQRAALGGAGGGPYVFTNAEAEAVVTAMSVTPDDTRKALIDTFVGSLKAAGVWTKTDVMWVLAAHDEQAARLNWKSPGNFTLTAVNAPTFTADRGFTGDGSTSYLDTGWDYATNGAQYTQDNAHIMVYQRTDLAGIATFAQVGLTRIGVGGSTSGAEASGVSVNGPIVTPANGGTVPMMAMGRRNSAADVSMLRDGVEVLTPTASVSTTTSNNIDLCFLRRNAARAAAQIAGGAVGAYLDDTESLAQYNAWHTFMVAIGADT